MTQAIWPSEPIGSRTQVEAHLRANPRPVRRLHRRQLTLGAKTYVAYSVNDLLELDSEQNTARPGMPY